MAENIRLAKGEDVDVIKAKLDKMIGEDGKILGAKLPYASTEQAGVIKLRTIRAGKDSYVDYSGISVDPPTGEAYVDARSEYGLMILPNSGVQIFGANTDEITAQEQQYKPIVPATLSHAVQTIGGKLSDLVTTAKASYVAAINELKTNLSGKADKTQYASTEQAGLIKLHKRGDGTNISGIVVGDDGTAYIATKDSAGTRRDGAGAITIVCASEAEITEGTSTYKPIVPSNLSTAVQSIGGKLSDLATNDKTSYTAAINELSSIQTNIVAGSYTGDNEQSRFISLGFTPKAVLCMTNRGIQVQATSHDIVYGGLAVLDSPLVADQYSGSDGPKPAITIKEDGFEVYYSIDNNYQIRTNQLNIVYNYVAIS